jgi:hypothetical protein
MKTPVLELTTRDQLDRVAVEINGAAYPLRSAEDMPTLAATIHCAKLRAQFFAARDKAFDVAATEQDHLDFERITNELALQAIDAPSDVVLRLTFGAKARVVAAFFSLWPPSPPPEADRTTAEETSATS